MRTSHFRSLAASALLAGAMATAVAGHAGPAMAQSTGSATPPAAAAQAPAGGGTSAQTGSTPDNDKKIVAEQKDNEILASTYIGQTLYNSNDKSIGDISDLVFDKNGGIKAAVVGVGGFLGIGQKSVAVAFDRIEIQRKPDSTDVKLVSDITAEQLKAAPAFRSLQIKMDEKHASKPASGGAGGDTSDKGKKP